MMSYNEMYGAFTYLYHNSVDDGVYAELAIQVYSGLLDSAHCIMNIVTECGVTQGYVPFSAASFPAPCHTSRRTLLCLMGHLV